MRGPRLRFLGGVREIGGSKLLVEDGPDRLLFDFGPSFSPRFEEFYVNFLQPRSTSPVKDLLEFDLLPRVDGLYSAEALYGSDLRHVPPEVHGVFVSHAHIDHAGHLALLDPTIPVYVGERTKRILDAIESSSGGHYGDHPWHVLPPGGRARVGGVEVEALPVDHSVPGATAFLIRTSEGTVVYTGDFRAHGPRGGETREFLAAAARERPIALVMEGTRAGPDPRPDRSEAGVREGVDRILGGSRRLAVVSHYPRDIDRLTTLYRAAVAAGREFVIPLKTAHLLATVGADLPPGAPVPGSSPGLRVYRRTKKVYYRWERPFLDESVDAAWVREHAGELLLSLDLHHFAELIDIRPEAGTPFIHSMSEPFSEDDVDDRVLHNWLDHFGLGFCQMHASGHASGPELLEIARHIGARSLFPIHTEHPEAFIPAAGHVVPPELGATYPLRSS